MKNRLQFVLKYIFGKKKELAVFAVCCVIFLFTFGMYGITLKAAAYPTFVCFVIILTALTVDACMKYGKWKRMQEILQKTVGDDGEFVRILGGDELNKIVDSDDIMQVQLLEVIRKLKESGMCLGDSMNMKYADMVDYYTMWAHQIKTPIASMHLILQKQDSEDSRRLRTELMRIEQYVEMVLCFLRLDSDSTDYVLKEYRLDDIIRTAIRKLAPQFIMKKLVLDYETIDKQVLTDEKWLGFVIEQVLSNAVKYTESGKVKISCEGSKLVISDTGIGIAPDDLPRIFDIGYTGFNGRMDRKASGIGLYLCRRICNNLGHGITAESVPGQGTTIAIELERNNLEVE